MDDVVAPERYFYADYDTAAEAEIAYARKKATVEMTRNLHSKAGQ